jgi:ribosomal-protein-alanine N-acetyltransferase
MERMPYTLEMDAAMQSAFAEATADKHTTIVTPAPAVVSEQWQDGLPTLTGAALTLRELRASDAPSLFMHLTTEEVARFISPPPTSVEGFERFIGWAHRERAAGRYACFAIVPQGSETAVGLFQLRQLEANWETAEWGFVLGSPYWGTGLFAEGAQLVLQFAFETVGVHRLEARAAVRNGRGMGALRKIGAVQEGLLRRSFFRHGEYLDQALWAILKEDWLQAKVVWGPRVH